MSVDGDLHAALMARVETLSGFTLVYPSLEQNEPEGEYVRVSHLPNDNQRVGLKDTDPLRRRGFIVLTLCSPLGEHEAVYRDRAGNIAAHFTGQVFDYVEDTVSVHSVTVKPGRRERNHWETPVWVDYRN
ncbi:hypothetical protein NBRC116590_02760 [Pelagimonas sp. KU-00592-HH]|uniref:phage tail terminator-like protein n=1 Tax=Pelagimonas sp. KU-00592-HH TaxID=3127651 RepID=UPI0031077843